MGRIAKYTIGAIVIVFSIYLVFLTAHYVQNNDAAQAVVEKFGYLGIVMIAIIGGFNIFVPIHVATFSPIFLSAGFSFETIISALVIGTTIADIVCYYLGILGKQSTARHYPQFAEKLERISLTHQKFLLPGIFLYASLAPLPNEIMLVPLGLMGLRLKTFFIPLLFGNLVNHTLFAFGFFHAFNYFF